MSYLKIKHKAGCYRCSTQTDLSCSAGLFLCLFFFPLFNYSIFYMAEFDLESRGAGAAFQRQFMVGTIVIYVFQKRCFLEFHNMRCECDVSGLVPSSPCERDFSHRSRVFRLECITKIIVYYISGIYIHPRNESKISSLADTSNCLFFSFFFFILNLSTLSVGIPSTRPH